MTLTQQELDTLFLQSFRYCLGRTSYAVSDYCSMLITHKDSLSDSTLSCIKRELKDAFAKDDCDREFNYSYRTLGHDCDRDSWSFVLEEISHDCSCGWKQPVETFEDEASTLQVAYDELL